MGLNYTGSLGCLVDGLRTQQSTNINWIHGNPSGLLTSVAGSAFAIDMNAGSIFMSLGSATGGYSDWIALGSCEF